MWGLGTVFDIEPGEAVEELRQMRRLLERDPPRLHKVHALEAVSVGQR